MKIPMNRRSCLGLLGTAALGVAASRLTAAPARPKVAAVFTELRVRSHAFHILSNLMGPYLFRGKWTEPDVDVVSWYADQFPERDMARESSERLKVPLYKTIDEALCLGGRELAVDAVVLIGEHGRYPKSELGQTMYPRKEFFDQIVAVIERSKRPVPVFNDKHLSYRWDWAKAMYDDAQRLGIPFMAGSSVPLAERRPSVELPPDAVVEEAVSIHGGGIESYDFHALEVMQSMIEARRGGETGISRVELLEGDACRQAYAAGRFSRELVDAAMNAEKNAQFARRNTPPAFPPEPYAPRHAVLVTYKDGTKGTALTVGNYGDRWTFACRLRGRAEPLATAFNSGPWGNWNLFCALSAAIAHFFKTRQSPYPVERTLLVTGAVDAAMHSKHESKPIDTPHLEFSYRTQNFRDFCETGESWNVITSEMPEHMKFEPGHG